MMKGIWNSRPSARDTLITIAIGLVVGVLIAGLHPVALFGLAFTAGLLVVMTLSNYDPDAFQKHYHYREYTLTEERNELCNLLVALTAAIKSKDDAAVEAQAKKAREYLDTFSPGLRTH